jgi:iron complex transport system substrate-binding protein
MRHSWLSSGVAIFLSLILVACTATNTPQSKETANPLPTTNSNPEQLPKASVKRIVALTSLSADIIYQLDKSKLVGMTGSSLLNKDPKFKDITRVSEERTPPNLEKIVALKPDLVIGAEGFSNQTTDKLKQLGINTLLTKVDGWESLEALTKNLAQLISAEPQPLLNRYKSFLKNDSKCKDDKCKISTLVLVSRQPILSPNKFSWAGNLLTKFPVKNVAADLQGKSPIGGYVTLSAEKILAANPEVLILVNPPQGSSPTQILDDFKKEPFWNQLQAVKNNRVYVFDYYGLVNAGSIDSIEKASKQLQQALVAK